jgi:hypothetical protein
MVRRRIETVCSVVLLLLFSMFVIFGESMETPDGAQPAGILLWESAAIDDPDHARHTSVVLGVEDVTEDGIPDIIAAIAEHVQIYAGDGAGRFSLAEDIPLSDRVQMAADPYPCVILSAGLLCDLDADGALEILVGSTYLESAESERGALFVLAAGDEGYEIADVHTCNGAPERIRVVQRDGGASEIWLANWTSVGEEIQRLVVRDGSVEEDSRVLVLDDRWNVAGLRDIDGDGLLDALLTHIEDGVVVRFGNSEGRLGEAQTIADLAGISFVQFGDLNGDGSEELVASGTIGMAVISRPWPASEDGISIYDLAMAVRETVVDDFNGDGALDVAAVADRGQRILVFSGLGNGELASPQTFIPTLPVGWAGDPLIARDLDCDGAPDLVLTAHHGLRVMMNGGAEPWGTSQIPFGGDKLLGVGDVDLDGDIDILAQGVEGIDVLRNEGGVLVLEPDVVSLGGQWCDAAIVCDGCVYALSTHPEASYLPRLTWYRAFDPEQGRIALELLEADTLPVLACGDLDGDRETDVFGTNGEDVWVAWGGRELAFYDGGPSPSLVAAIDNDAGHQDIILVSTADYADFVRISFRDRQPQVSEPILRLLSLPCAMASGDLDGDGLADVLFAATDLDVESAESEEELSISVSGATWGVILASGRATSQAFPEFAEGEMINPFVPPVLARLDDSGDLNVALTTTSASGVRIYPLRSGLPVEPATIVDKGVGPLYAADLDGNGIDELIGSTLGLFPVVWIRWNGGER